MTTPSPADFEPFLAPSRGSRPGAVTPPSRAFERLPDGARVLVDSACGAPMLLLDELTSQRGRWSRMEIITGQLHARLPMAAHPGEPFTFASIQPSESHPAVSAGGVARVVPARYSDTRFLFLPSGPLAVDAAIVQVSAPGPDGRFSLGVSVGAVIDAVRSAPLVIAQVNPRMPYTYGAGELRRDEIDVLVEMEGPLVELHRDEPNEEARAIAGHVLTQVNDGATLQFGIGAVPEALMAMLGERRELGIHSGMVSDGIADLVDCGAVTNTRKGMDDGVCVAGEVLGTRRLFDWAHMNPRLRMAPSGYTHGVPLLSRLRHFVSIQSALQVALDGSINAEAIGDRQVGGPGGQPDYAEAAAATADGIAIHALPATAARGKASRIVRHLDAGAIVTTPRYLADRVITEFGIAYLRGRTLEERAEALRAVAHPDFRGGL